MTGAVIPSWSAYGRAEANMRPVATIAAMPGVAEPAHRAHDGGRELQVVGQDRPVEVHRDGPHRGRVEIRWQRAHGAVFWTT